MDSSSRDTGKPAPERITLVRSIGLLSAASANMLAMLGWLLGAVAAICDGFVWAELGAAMPGTGVPYRYLLEADGPQRFGLMMSFLFIWETICLAPLSIGSGAVGFGRYARHL
jgi:hypothetical protein